MNTPSLLYAVTSSNTFEKTDLSTQSFKKEVDQETKRKVLV
jgi:hypothetical protein